MKAILLLSSGIDSPVAGHLLKKDLDLIALNFNPLNNIKEEKIKKLCEKLKIKKYIIIPFAKIQSELIEKSESKYRCVLCKRFMLRIAELIAKGEKADYIITGENIGQVASQTLSNMKIITKAVSTTVLRPLLCYDKQEIINLAKKIGTYEISINNTSCCKALPEHPCTSSNLLQIEKEEEKLNINELAEEAIKNAKGTS